LVTVKVPLENIQLSAVDPLKMSISAVPMPNVTAETVTLPFAVKSFVAASANTGTSRNVIANSFLNTFLTSYGS
jgi:hypothetical protein